MSYSRPLEKLCDLSSPWDLADENTMDCAAAIAVSSKT